MNIAAPRARVLWVLLALVVTCAHQPRILAAAPPVDTSTAPPLPIDGSACEGRAITSVQFAGCPGTFCEDEERRDQLLEFTGIHVDDPWRQDAIAQATRRLLETRFFYAVTPRCERRGDGANLVFEVAGTWLVRDVHIEGQQFYYESDIRKRVFLRRGTVLDPREAQLQEELDRQRASIRRLYARAGFHEAHVDITIQELERGEVNVRIRINEGAKARIRRVDIGVRHSGTAGGRLGCPTVKKSLLKSVAQLGRGDLYTVPAARKARGRMLALLRRVGYLSPHVSYDYDDDSQRLSFRVEVGRCFDVGIFVRESAAVAGEESVEFRRVTDDSLYETLTFDESGAYDAAEAELGRQALEDLYEARGHLFADVRFDYRDFTVDRRDPTTPPDVAGAVHYFITEDSDTEIRGIFFHDTHAFTRAQIQEWMQTEVYDFFGEGGFLQVQRLIWDLGNIRDHYHDAGYLRFRYTGCADAGAGAVAPADASTGTARFRRERRQYGDWTIVHYAYEDLCFTVARRDIESSVYVNVTVDEGPLSRLGEIRLDGVSALAPDDLSRVLGLRRGEPFSPHRVSEATRRLQQHYRSLGYYPADVTATCSAPGETCRMDEVTADEVAITVHIKEGHRRVIGERFVRGNFHTADRIVLRDLPAPGDPYDEDRLLSGIRKLRDLGVFDSLKVTSVGVEGESAADRIGLIVDVEESPAKFVDLAIGFETLNRNEQSMPGFITGTLSDGLALTDQRVVGHGESALIRLPDLLFVTEARFVHRNFLGLAKELIIPLKYGLSTTEVNRLASFKPTYLDARFLGHDLLFRLTPFVVYDRATQALDQFLYGAEVELSKQFTHALHGSVIYELSRIQVRDPGIPDASFGPFILQNKLNPRLSYDGTDNPLNPQHGFYLGGSVAYINALEQTTFDNFLKLEGVAKLYISLRATVTLAFFIHTGWSYSFENQDLPANERYKLGGSSGLRGYADDAVGQYTSNGELRASLEGAGADAVYHPVRGGDVVINGSVEIRFPILRKLDVWGAGFFDWGALAEDFRDMNPMSLRMSVGLGLRWLAGGQVPIRLDYGVILDPRCRTYTAAADGARECVQEEFGNLHFGVLYTF